MRRISCHSEMAPTIAGCVAWVLYPNDILSMPANL